jgi:hypothetical protein
MKDNQTHHPIAKAIAALIIIGALTGAGYVAFIKAPDATVNTVDRGANKAYDFVKRIAKDIDSVIHFRPVATVEGKTVLESSRSIAELSTKEKRFEHTYSWTNTKLMSTKKIILKGTYVAKAGFDLSKPFAIDVSEDLQRVRTKMPPAKILSMDQKEVNVIEDAGGWWNSISKEDRQAAMNSLKDEAQKALEATTFLTEAETDLAAQIENIIRKSAPPSASIVREPLP